MDNSGSMCDEIIESYESNFKEKKAICQTQKSYILLTFYLLH